MASRKKDPRVNVAGVVRTKRTKPLSVNSPPSFDPMRFVAPVDAKSREALIAELAYFRALKRSFEPGHEVEDWLAAEAEIEKREGV
jgi:Protein of unknown function (DUF2934)